jgi:hypothetical protein
LGRIRGEKFSQIAEQGDIFFHFYKPKVEADEVSSAEDVKRFYINLEQIMIIHIISPYRALRIKISPCFLIICTFFPLL